MARSFLISAGLALCWMFSPDALVLLGNSAGRGGMMFLAPLSIAAIITILAMSLIHHPLVITASDNAFSQLARELGSLPAMTLTLAGRLSLVLLLPTGMLVTAGFTFNETFLYWFPNFAFAFLTLGFILSLHLAGNHIARSWQPFFVGLTAGCLVLLSVVGFAGSHEIQVTSPHPENQSFLSPSLFTCLLLLFLGYDQQDHSPSSRTRPFYTWAILTGFLVIALWGTVSLIHVPSETLSDSTIPYILSAREILGQPGRIIIGIAVISGVCGMVNGLFLLAGNSIQQMAAHISLPLPAETGWRQKSGPVIFSVIIAIFMATGLAGDDNLEIYTFGALLLWLLTVGAYCFSASRKLHKVQRGRSLYHYALSAVFPLAVIWMASTYSHTTTLIVFCFLLLASSAIFSAFWLWFARKTDNNKTSI